jgi:hypothetical protein
LVVASVHSVDLSRLPAGKGEILALYAKACIRLQILSSEINTDGWVTVSKAARLADCNPGTISKARDRNEIAYNRKSGADRQFDPKSARDFGSELKSKKELKAFRKEERENALKSRAGGTAVTARPKLIQVKNQNGAKSVGRRSG